ncbi:hypothetical protein EVAR_80379_1 [Eumeta japonica]|uniref:Uncharacterized protein n=1 Tax=Eumeta variegata TaxID=151549 RepID=A0A4C1VG23_EUMVA|nr:hypothetical protein EVAR_80379_1 [Eumeta japonica]
MTSSQEFHIKQSLKLKCNFLRGRRPPPRAPRGAASHENFFPRKRDNLRSSRHVHRDRPREKPGRHIAAPASGVVRGRAGARAGAVVRKIAIYSSLISFFFLPTTLRNLSTCHAE